MQLFHLRCSPGWFAFSTFQRLRTCWSVPPLPEELHRKCSVVMFVGRHRRLRVLLVFGDAIWCSRSADNIYSPTQTHTHTYFQMNILLNSDCPRPICRRSASAGIYETTFVRLLLEEIFKCANVCWFVSEGIAHWFGRGRKGMCRAGRWCSGPEANKLLVDGPGRKQPDPQLSCGCFRNGEVLVAFAFSPEKLFNHNSIGIAACI